MTQDIRKGDTVRVTREFVVGLANTLDIYDDNSEAYSRQAHTFAVLSRRKPQVGDTVTRGYYAELPVGTVVRGAPTAGPLLKTILGWRATGGSVFSDDDLASDRKIVFLP